MRRSILILLLAAGGAIVPVRNGLAADAAQVQAAYIFNLAKYVTWPAPASNQKTVKLCGAGNVAFGSILSTFLKGKDIGGKNAVYESLGAPGGAGGCHLLFVPADAGNGAQFLKAATGKPVLTVSDTEGMLQKGTMVALVLDGGKIKLKLNAGAAKKAGLTFAPALLKVAQ